MKRRGHQRDIAQPKQRKPRRRESLHVINSLRTLDAFDKMVNEFARALGVDRSTVQGIFSALDALDKNFTTDNWDALEKKLKSSATQVSPLKVTAVNELSEATIDGTVSVLKESRVAKATSVVFLDCKYEKEDCVVKLMERGIDMVELFIETIINIIMNKVVQANEFITVPHVKTMGTVLDFPIQDTKYPSKSIKGKTAKQETRLILIQEKVNGVEFSDIDSQSDLLQALYLLCGGLTELQEKYNFVHRDFHEGNVMYEKKSKNVSIIDFGYACFTIKDTPGSIQTFKGGYGYDQINEYKSHVPCVNQSHDICTLILSLLKSEKNKNIQWLLELGQRICTKYLSVINERSRTFENEEGFDYMNKLVKNSALEKTATGEWKCQSPYNIFHPWYVYELFDIDIGMTPAEVDKYLLDKAAPLVTPPYTKQLKSDFDLTAVSNMVGNLKF